MLHESRDEVRVAVHVLVNDVVEEFELLVESMPPAERIDELVSYFEHTYIRGHHKKVEATTAAHPF